MTSLMNISNVFIPGQNFHLNTNSEIRNPKMIFPEDHEFVKQAGNSNFTHCGALRGWGIQK